MQYTYNYQIYISSKLPIISVEAGGEESWISDDSCDDVNNNQFCNFDGGDCCGANVIKQYCIDCDCLGKLKKICFGIAQRRTKGESTCALCAMYSQLALVKL